MHIDCANRVHDIQNVDIAEHQRNIHIKLVFGDTAYKYFALHKQDCLTPVAAEHIFNLVHSGSNQTLNVVVTQVVALDELVVQRALAFQLLGAGLGDTECVAIVYAVLDVIITALVTIPQLYHGGRKDKLNIANIHFVAPCVLDHEVVSHILGKVQEVKSEDHALLEREAGVHTAHQIIKTNLFTPTLSQ